MSMDLQTPFHYARDHDGGPGAWCVRGPDRFYLSVPEKNLAWCIAAMMNGHGAKASKEFKELQDILKDNWPSYLREPARDAKSIVDQDTEMLAITILTKKYGSCFSMAADELVKRLDQTVEAFYEDLAEDGQLKSAR